VLATEERVDRLETMVAELVRQGMEVNRALLKLERLSEAADARLTRLEKAFDESRLEAEKDREETRRDREETKRDREETKRDREETKHDREETKRDRKELFRQLGDISNKMGTIVEDMIAPSLRRMAEEELGCGSLTLFGYRLEKYHPLTRQRREFDVIAAGQKAVLFNDTKASARPEYAKEFWEFLQSGEFFTYFPEYMGQPLVPVFASLYIPDDVLTYLTRRGIYAVAMGDEMMEILNKEEVLAQKR